MQSRLILSTQYTSSGCTQLKDCFVSPPFKLMTLPGQGKRLEAIQMSSSPGLLAGDHLTMELHLAAQTDLHLTTQAFTRVQSMHEGQFAEQHNRFYLQKNSCLCYLPHPLVLHKDSALKQTTYVEMEEGSRFIYGETVAIGRVLNGEVFAFRQFSSYLRIMHQSIPLLSDRIQWIPERSSLNALSQMENFSHQGTFVYMDLAATPSSLKDKVEQLQARFAEEESCVLGVSLLDKGGFLVRAVAYRADTIEKIFQQLGVELYQ
ncbi:urease accessory protein UreD [Pelistega europaea]|uniref:Urease accessory protein UreD n=1 Tax=Pelistega europaea TaxID=106147 RepID=A0A7Y4P727_9BURK|nr:urease accessory protein UreD [Pelistega europaea]NOL50504.1 urease accessory protein UreD [Pelistega europaea]